MKKKFFFSSLAILFPFLINGMASSADLLPMKIGQKFIYKRTNSANPPNSWYLEVTVINKENVCSEEYFKLRLRDYSIGETNYIYLRSTEKAFFECDIESGVKCLVVACEPVDTCEGENAEVMEPETVTIPFGGPYQACVVRKHTENEPDLPYWYIYHYAVPGVGMIKEVDWWNDNPPITTELVEIQLQSQDEIIGSWSSGIWYWDVTAAGWTRMTASSPTGDIAAGDFTGDGKADVASIWSSGLWYQDGATLDWTKVSGPGAVHLAAGDVTGDGRSEVISTWSNGIWYYDAAVLKWTKMTSSSPTGEIASGDFNCDGKADVASIWRNGLWYQDGALLDWTKVSNTAPTRLTAGDVTGDGCDEIIGTWSDGIWHWGGDPPIRILIDHRIPDGDIAAGDFTGDGITDIASCWDSGLWYQDSATLDWTKVSNTAPTQLTAGDITGD